MNLDEEVPYLHPPTAPTDDPVTDKDDEDYTTLKKVEEILDREIENLKVDFTALNAKDATKLQAQVLGRQEAYDILGPVHEMVKSAINSVEEQRKGA